MPLLFGGFVIGAGCDDYEQGNNGDPSAIELRDGKTRGPEQESVDPNVIPGQYIVMMTAGANPHAAATAVAARPERVFEHAFPGFAGPLTSGQVTALAARKDVRYIEPDQIITAAAIQCPNDGTCPDPTTQIKTGAPEYAPAWSVDRVDQRNLPFSYSYTYTCSGEDVDVYIFDTYLDTTHPDFEGRARRDYDAYPNEPATGESCSGHATHVAGLVGGAKYGVAKDATLISVEVLDCTGHGTWSKLIDGIDWVLAHKDDNQHHAMAVANMSLSGGWSLSVNAAVNELADSGVFVAVAAGNNTANACWYSPSSASQAMVVAASNTLDQITSFSNFGGCVDIYAGGSNVRSDWIGGGSATGSGTSMATPHVAGVAALYKQTFGETSSSQIKSDLEDAASKNKISNNPSGTPNRLLYWPCSGSNM